MKNGYRNHYFPKIATTTFPTVRATEVPTDTRAISTVGQRRLRVIWWNRCPVDNSREKNNFCATDLIDQLQDLLEATVRDRDQLRDQVAEFRRLCDPKEEIVLVSQAEMRLILWPSKREHHMQEPHG